MKEFTEDCIDGVMVGGRLLNATRFADQAMLESSSKGLQRIMDKLMR